MFQPVIPADGLLGWRLLQKTYDTQFKAFSDSTLVKRDTDYFRKNIAKIDTAEELVSDRRLLTVALGAFGLQDDINNKYFIRKILEEGTADPEALANRFTDKRYKDLSKAFGFGPVEIQYSKLSTFPDKIIAQFERQSFEVAVGQQSDTLRIALAAERTFEDIADSTSKERTKWFEILGNPPMRKLFETVFNLPASFGQIDVDRQAEVFADRSEDIFGTSNPSDFADPELQEKLLTRYTALSQLNTYSPSTSGASVALTLLSGF